MMLFVSIASILLALAAMAYVFSSLRSLEDSVDKLEARNGARPKEPIVVSKPVHPLNKKR